MLSLEQARIPSVCPPDNQNALQSLSASSLNARSAFEAPSRKRKRNNAVDEHNLGGAFTIYPHSSSYTDKPLKLTPRLLVPRSRLPLAFIDLDVSTNGPTGSRLFRASIGVLENEASELPGQDGAQVVIAEQDDNCTLCVVERVTRGTYTLCRLYEWVALSDFQVGPRISKRSLSRYPRREDDLGDRWWKEAAVDIRYKIHQRYQEIQSSKGYTEIRLSMKPPTCSIPKAEILKEQIPVEKVGTPDELQRIEKNFAAPHSTGDIPMTIEDVSNLVRTQYLESLYISKTSLAYFAKGPLSRARALVNQFPRSESCLTELSEYLRSNILSRAMTEKRYSDALPNLVRELPVGICSDDEEGHIVSILGDKLRKSKKRKKVTKNGVFPGEEEYVTRWHFNVERAIINGGPDISREKRIQSCLVEQRARETQLQIILILEVLALEKSGENVKSQTIPDPTSDKSQGKGQSTTKKPHDLPALIDTLVERLCIWQSTSQEEASVVRDDAPGKSDNANLDKSIASNNNQLRDFCTEVVIPFYAARLPELTSSICQKLGGPTGSSPHHSSMSKPCNSHQNPPKPGTAVQRNPHQMKRRTLERVHTDDKTATRRAPPTLARSATEPVIPGIKREPSEISLSAISNSNSHRSIPKSYVQREVDLTAASQAAKAKLQRKVAIEQELKGAIATLKKPNPRLAVKELVDSAEERTARTLSKSRKSNNPVRNLFAQGVQVVATPKGNRRKNVFGHLPRLPNIQVDEPREAEMIPPSSDPRIPSSSIRPSLLVDETNKSTNRHFSWPVPTLEQTPSRKAARADTTSLCDAIKADQDVDELSQASSELPTLVSQPLFTRPSAPGRRPSYTLPPLPTTAQVTPSRKVATTGNHTQTGSSIQDTPVKGGGKTPTVEKLLDNVPKNLQTPKTAVITQQSIYESLGWGDNDVDELL